MRIVYRLLVTKVEENEPGEVRMLRPGEYNVMPREHRALDVALTEAEFLAVKRAVLEAFA